MTDQAKPARKKAHGFSLREAVALVLRLSDARAADTTVKVTSASAGGKNEDRFEGTVSINTTEKASAIRNASATFSDKAWLDLNWAVNVKSGIVVSAETLLLSLPSEVKSSRTYKFNLDQKARVLAVEYLGSSAVMPLMLNRIVKDSNDASADQDSYSKALDPSSSAEVLKLFPKRFSLDAFGSDGPSGLYMLRHPQNEANPFVGFAVNEGFAFLTAPPSQNGRATKADFVDFGSVELFRRLAADSDLHVLSAFSDASSMTYKGTARGASNWEVSFSKRADLAGHLKPGKVQQTLNKLIETVNPTEGKTATHTVSVVKVDELVAASKACLPFLGASGSAADITFTRVDNQLVLSAGTDSRFKTSRALATKGRYSKRNPKANAANVSARSLVSLLTALDQTRPVRVHMIADSGMMLMSQQVKLKGVEQAVLTVLVGSVVKQ
jgi:hypothetical protein